MTVTPQLEVKPKQQTIERVAERDDNDDDDDDDDDDNNNNNNNNNLY